MRQVLLGLANGAMSEEGLVEALRHLGSPLSPPWNLTVVMSARTSGWTIPPEQLSGLLRRIEGSPNAVAAELQGALWVLSGSRRIDKVRSVVDLGRHRAEVDVYGAELEGLATVEVEFASLDEAAGFEPPGWFGEEVTGRSEWGNAALAVHGRPPSG